MTVQELIDTLVALNKPQGVVRMQIDDVFDDVLFVDVVEMYDAANGKTDDYVVLEC